MNRYKASATHLAISATVIALFFAIVFFVWYPVPYFSIEGTYDVIIILIAVDLVLGPLLTLIIFKSGKPGLKFDLSIIACIQIAALLYGANTIYAERPYFVAFALNKFVIVQATDTKKMDLSKIDPSVHYQHLGPSYVYAESPSDNKLRDKILNQVLSGGFDIDRIPSQYRDFKTHIKNSFDRSLNLDILSTQLPGNKAIIDRFLKRYPSTEHLAFYPLSGKHRDIVMVLDKNSLEVIDYIDLDPWKATETPAPKVPNIKEQFNLDLDNITKEAAPIPGLSGAPNL